MRGNSPLRVMVAMSGGVDSSVACLLLREMGHECIGATIKTWPKEECESTGGRMCCSLDAVDEARTAAGKIGVSHYVFDFSREFREHIREYYLAEYARGRTPSPCILCNSRIKFGLLMQKAARLGCGFIATGHYARVARDSDNGRFSLKRGTDRAKDQSYFLSGLTQGQLSGTLFPLGGLAKDRVRSYAASAGIKSHDRPGSRDICFSLPRPDAGPGDIVFSDGKKLGTHKGIASFTIGQRKGLGIGYSEPLYVTGIDARRNIVRVGPKKDAFGRELAASGVNWIVKPKLPARVKAQVRYGQEDAVAVVRAAGRKRVLVRFSKPVFAPAPGQAVVFYRGDTVLGGGWIDEVKK